MSLSDPLRVEAEHLVVVGGYFSLELPRLRPTIVGELPVLLKAVTGELSSVDNGVVQKCHFQVTPKIDKALVVKGFLVLGVTLS